MSDTDLLTTAEAADALGLSRAHVQRLVRTGQLPGRRVGPRLFLLERTDVERYQRRPPGNPAIRTLRAASLARADITKRGDGV